MHLLVPLSVDGHVDHHRREGAGDRGGRQDDLAKQSQGARVGAGGDGAHVPVHRFAGVEVGGPDHQQTALGVFDRDRVEQLPGDIALDQAAHRRGVGHGVAVQHGGEAALLEDVAVRNVCVGLGEHGVVGRAEEGERRDQRPGADPGDQLEARPGSGRGPTGQQTRPEGPVPAAARDGQEGDRRQWAGLAALGPPGELPFVGLVDHLGHRRVVPVRKEPGVGDRGLGLGGQGAGHGGQALRRGAAGGQGQQAERADEQDARQASAVILGG